MGRRPGQRTPQHRGPLVGSLGRIDTGALTDRVIARPIGGVLSDRIGAPRVVAISLSGAALLAVVIALQPPRELAAGSSFVAMAFALGLVPVGLCLGGPAVSGRTGRQRHRYRRRRRWSGRILPAAGHGPER
ncbi:MAG TPA: hypothetical protein VLJ88_10765 [Propionibacteriaceae bacterium]|nr:hypothetical protein [Propionibacteriaceae bacterium]